MKNTEWYISEGNQSPILLDKITSKKYVIVRRNVRNIERESATIYQYEEKKILRDEWKTYEDILSNRTDIDTAIANLDYVAMMADINIPTEDE